MENLTDFAVEIFSAISLKFIKEKAEACPLSFAGDISDIFDAEFLGVEECKFDSEILVFPYRVVFNTSDDEIIFSVRFNTKANQTSFHFSQA